MSAREITGRIRDDPVALCQTSSRAQATRRHAGCIALEVSGGRHAIDIVVFI